MVDVCWKDGGAQQLLGVPDDAFMSVCVCVCVCVWPTYGRAGTYRCPGFMDDDEFVRCSFRIHTSDASAPSRPKWQDPSDD